MLSMAAAARDCAARYIVCALPSSKNLSEEDLRKACANLQNSHFLNSLTEVVTMVETITEEVPTSSLTQGETFQKFLKDEPHKGLYAALMKNPGTEIPARIGDLNLRIERYAQHVWQGSLLAHCVDCVNKAEESAENDTRPRQVLQQAMELHGSILTPTCEPPPHLLTGEQAANITLNQMKTQVALWAKELMPHSSDRMSHDPANKESRVAFVDAFEVAVESTHEEVGRMLRMELDRDLEDVTKYRGIYARKDPLDPAKTCDKSGLSAKVTDLLSDMELDKEALLLPNYAREVAEVRKWKMDLSEGMQKALTELKQGKEADYVIAGGSPEDSAFVAAVAEGKREEAKRQEEAEAARQEEERKAEAQRKEAEARALQEEERKEEAQRKEVEARARQEAEARARQEEEQARQEEERKAAAERKEAEAKAKKEAEVQALLDKTKTLIEDGAKASKASHVKAVKAAEEEAKRSQAEARKRCLTTAGEEPAHKKMRSVAGEPDPSTTPLSIQLSTTPSERETLRSLFWRGLYHPIMEGMARMQADEYRRGSDGRAFYQNKSMMAALRGDRIPVPRDASSPESPEDAVAAQIRAATKESDMFRILSNLFHLGESNKDNMAKIDGFFDAVSQRSYGSFDGSLVEGWS